MKWLIALLGFAAAQIAFSAPLEGRAPSVNDVTTVGYASLGSGTTGGAGSTPTTVTTLDQLISAVAGNDKKIIIIKGTIKGNVAVEVGSHTTILGATGSSLQGVGFRVLNQSNVILRNLKISKVLFAAGDAIGIQASSNVWVNHCDLSSDRDHDKDYYDGLLDVTHGSSDITVTNCKLHDHWKASLIGHSDDNGAQDKKITVTMALNHFANLNSRTPSVRFGHVHLFNNYYEDDTDGINTRDGAQLLVENNVWTGQCKALYETDGGFAVARGNIFGTATDALGGSALGTFTKAPYSYKLLPASSVKSSVLANAGQTLSFSAP